MYHVCVLTAPWSTVVENLGQASWYILHLIRSIDDLVFNSAESLTEAAGSGSSLEDFRNQLELLSDFVNAALEVAQSFAKHFQHQVTFH